MKKALSIILLLLISFNCSKDDNITPEEEIIKEPETVAVQEVNYSITLPEKIDKGRIENFKISNVYGDFPITFTSGKSSSKNGISNNNTSTIKVFENGSYQLIYLNDENGNPVMVDILKINGSLTKVNELSAETTAIAMLMTHPLLITSNESNFEAIKEKLKTMPSFVGYRNFVSDRIIESINNQFTPDFTSSTLFKQTIIELLNTSMENFNLPVGTMELKLNSRKNGKIEYSLINEHKRVLHFYPKKVYLDNLGIPIDDKEEDYPILNIDGFPELGIIPEFDILYPKGFNFWESTWSLIKGEQISVFKTESHGIEKDLGDADQLKIDVYGLGQLDKPFEDLSEEDKVKFLMVGAHSVYTDFIIPIIDLFYGIKNTQSSGTNNQRFDFRYGSRKKPVQALMNALSIQFAKDPNNIAQYSQYISNKDFLGAGQFLGSFIINEIVGDLQAQENKRRYLNYIYNIFKNTTGISKTSDAFRANLKKMMNQTSAVKNANFIGKVVKVGELATNVAGAIFAYNETPYKHSFTFNKTANQELNLLIPEENINLQEEDILFDWSFDRGVMIGPVFYNLIIKEHLKDGNIQEHKIEELEFTTYTLEKTKFNEDSYNFEWMVEVRRNNNSKELLIATDFRNFTVGVNTTQNITGITPQTAILNTETTFTITGENLTEGMGFWIADLSNITEISGGNSNERYFKGTPTNSIGIKDGVVKDAPGGTTLFNFQVTIENPVQNIYNGNITLTTQKEVDDFGANNYTKIEGNLIIEGNYNNDITSLNSLNSLIEIEGNLNITKNPLLQNLNGLNSLHIISGYIAISYNYNLINLSGLNSINSLKSALRILQNRKLTSLVGLNNLTSINGELRIESNDTLVNLDGLNELNSIQENLIITGNKLLSSLNGLDKLSSIGGIIKIGTRASINGSWRFYGNDALTNYCAISHLIKNGQISDDEYIVKYNAYNPNYEQIQNSGKGGCEQ